MKFIRQYIKSVFYKNIKIDNIYGKSKKILKDIYGENAQFREGQYEAIDATLKNRRTLVVQKTGWGKSLVYFICTKLLRDNKKGMTFVVSPLIVLMENQLEAAKKIGLKCDILNSTTRDRRIDIIDSMISNELDLVFITPETLFSYDIQSIINVIDIGLFVIDEAHSISDWGYDFRLEYSNIYKVLNKLNKNVPVLATTATANDRVIKDLKKQLGLKVHILRGSILRKSLSIQILKMPDIAMRYGWILENINKFPGSGIIYCLTQRDCDYLSEFLLKNGVNVRSYYSRNKKYDYLNKEAEILFKENKIKAIVSTVKLGMGYDKADISFVIHYQQPSNIVSYYQQIGRAGRNIDRAYTFLMCGNEDTEIQDYFINIAFPNEYEAFEIWSYIYDNNGATLGEITNNINITRKQIDKTLSFLINEGAIIKENYKYYFNKKYKYNSKHYNEITEIRKKEQRQMMDFVNTNKCYGKYIANCFDDYTAENCGICKNCLGYEEFSSKVDDKYINIAKEYIENLIITIEPIKMWVKTSITEYSKIENINQKGLCISKYGDPGYGLLVKEDKYSSEKRFRNELVVKSSMVLKNIIRDNNIKFITCVPSLRSDIVEDFTKRLAKKSGLIYITMLEKTESYEQKDMKNSSHQCENALKSFSIIEDVKTIPDNIILVDDVVDSRWTLTVCGNLLMKMGCKKVFPFALADSSLKER